MTQPNDKTQQTFNPLSTYAADIGKSANQLYNAGSGYRPYTGSVLAPLSPYTTQALSQTASIAGQPLPGLNDAFNFVNTLTANNGITPELSRVANDLRDNMSEVGGYLRPFADGSMQEDPRLAALLDTNANRAANAAATRFGGGRYGSAAIGQGVGTAVTDANNATMLQSNENARNRQLQASQALGSNVMQQAGILGNLYENGLSRAAGAASMLPTLNNLRYEGASRLAGVGDFYDQRGQTQTDADIKAWEANQNIDWNRIGGFANILNGTAPTAGSMVRSSGSKPSAAQGILGGAMTGGAAFGPWGALAGGILGGVL